MEREIEKVTLYTTKCLLSLSEIFTTVLTYVSKLLSEWNYYSRHTYLPIHTRLTKYSNKYMVYLTFYASNIRYLCINRYILMQCKFVQKQANNYECFKTLQNAFM